MTDRAMLATLVPLFKSVDKNYVIRKNLELYTLRRIHDLSEDRWHVGLIVGEGSVNYVRCHDSKRFAHGRPAREIHIERAA